MAAPFSAPETVSEASLVRWSVVVPGVRAPAVPGGGGAGGAGARGVVGERHARSRRAGIQREADGAVGGVAGLVGRLHVNRVQAVGQRGRIITRAEGATVDRIGDGGTVLRAGNRERGVAGQVVGGGAG